MPKQKFYCQHYRSEWEDEPLFRGWLKPVEGDSTKAFCAFCKTEIMAKYCDIRKHCETSKHNLKSNPYLDPKQNKIAFQTVSEIATHPFRTAETMLAMTIAEHCSILAIDHLGVVAKKAFADSKAASDFKLHRTKCTELIKQVLGPHFLKVLLGDLGSNKYSLLLDESTDISVSKYLGVVIRYFSPRAGEVILTFLGLVYLEKADATTIAKALSDLLAACGIEMSNLVGIGTDNAPVMTGTYNGLHEILKTQYQLPNLVLVRCVCHSLQLAVSHASKDCLPRNIEFLILLVFYIPKSQADIQENL